MTQLEQIMVDLKNLSQETVIEITTDLTANLIKATPVDTGWARANWVPSIGVPAGLGQSDVASRGAEQQSAVLSIITDYTLDKGDTFVSNNVQYIQALNGGHSKQAPIGFVEQAIEKAITTDQEDR